VTVIGASEAAGDVVLRSVEVIMHLINRQLPGLEVICHAGIPPSCGLGDHESWLVGGLMAINNLLGAPLHRDRIADIACKLTAAPAAAITELMGGLTVTNPDTTGGLVYRRLDIASMKVVLAVPESPTYRPPPAEAAFASRGTQLSQLVLLVEALRNADHDLLRQLTTHAHYLGALPAAAEVVTAAREAGASAVIQSGSGPACLAFAPTNHAQIEAALVRTWRDVGLACRTWTLNVDTQGVAISLQG
jgi:homoserine kinase